MAGMFDWLKGGGGAKSRSRRRTSGVNRREAEPQAPRDPSRATELTTPEQFSPTEAVVPPPRPEMPPAAPPAAAPASAEAGGSSSAPSVSAPPPPPSDPGATRYQTVTSNRTGLVGVLIVKEGRGCDTVHRVFDGDSRIGRGDAVEIRTDEQDDTVSREHAVIHHQSGHFTIRPLKEGLNPTFLNEEEVSGSAVLRDGDLIRVGNTILKFRAS